MPDIGFKVFVEPGLSDFDVEVHGAFVDGCVDGVGDNA